MLFDFSSSSVVRISGTAKSGLVTQLHEDITVGYIQSPAEEPAQDLFRQRGSIGTGLLGEIHQSVGIQRVRHMCNQVKAKIDSFALAGCRQLGKSGLEHFRITKFTRKVFLEWHALDRHARIELKRKPGNDAGSMNSTERVIEAPLAEEAPGADQVGNNVDLQRCRRALKLVR